MVPPPRRRLLIFRLDLFSGSPSGSFEWLWLWLWLWTSSMFLLVQLPLGPIDIMLEKIDLFNEIVTFLTKDPVQMLQPEEVVDLEGQKAPRGQCSRGENVEEAGRPIFILLPAAEVQSTDDTLRFQGRKGHGRHTAASLHVLAIF